MSTLVIGANSYLGARIFFDLKDKYDLVGTYFSNKLSDEFIHLDIENPDEVREVLEKIKPEMIIHLASNPNRKWADANPEKAKQLNIEGTKNIVKEANKINSKIIYISTVAVFDEDKKNMYAVTKSSAELIIKTTKVGWLILRPAVILGCSPQKKNNRPFDRYLKNIFEKTLEKYPTVNKTQVTWIGHISEVIDEILKNHIIGETIEIASPGIKSRYDLAVDLVKPFGGKFESENNDEKTSVFDKELNSLSRLGLKTYTYEQIRGRIIEEIKNKDKYIL